MTQEGGATDGRVLGLREIAMPVAVVAARTGGSRSCATTTVMYASIDPPYVVSSLAASSATLRLVESSRELVVSLLCHTQRDIAERAGRHVGDVDDKVAALGIPVTGSGPSAGLGIAGALAVLSCMLVDVVGAGDHRCCVGAVRDAEVGGTGLPLLRFRRAYAALGATLGGDEGYPI
jgi:3-hydroxy-9,10-secoandrosta-1,3,5(10)-triene-9,17-dione monooxygenase reductase component